MKMRVLAGGALAALMIASAGSAAAQDRLIERPSRHQPTSLHGLQGTAWWTQLARCAGFFDSVANGSERLGRAADTRAAEKQADSLFEMAVRRAAADRGLAREAVLDIVAPEVAIGRGVGERLWARRDRTASGWNMFRSQCLDVGSTYASMGLSS
ncbi:MAG TPA: hypothetical protein VF699_09195 [Caulobacteraceae bacterium]|jgi:hypothetical protein